jgi:phenylacetate-CoA ligase
VDRAELLEYHESFGTTGPPVSTWFTGQDLRENAAATAEWGVGFREDDTVMVRFPYAISLVAHAVHAAAQLKGACVIPAGARSTVSPFPRVVELMRKLDVTVLACLPLQALLIAETAEVLGLDPRRGFPSLRAICTAGEPLPKGRRGLLEEIWGKPLFDNYGLTETGVVALDCARGRLHPLLDRFILEVLDDNMQPVKPGKAGWLAITSLRMRATPLLRFLTGDRARLVKEACLCGGEYALEIRGRKEAMIAVGARTFDLWDLDGIVARLPHRRFWAAGPIPGGLRFVVENDAEDGADAAAPDPAGRLEEEYRVKLRIDLVPRGSLYDRGDLLAVHPVGKPRYIYTAEEMEKKAYQRTAEL